MRFLLRNERGNTWVDLLLYIIVYSLPVGLALLTVAYVFSDKLVLWMQSYGRLGV